MKWNAVGHLPPSTAGGSSPRNIARTASAYSRISRHGPVDRLPVPRFDRDSVGDADPEHHSPAGDLVDGRRGLRRRGRRPRVDRQHPGAEPDPLGPARVGGQHRQGVAAGDVGDVGGVVAERLGEADSFGRGLQRAARRDEGADAGHAGSLSRALGRGGVVGAELRGEPERPLVEFGVDAARSSRASTARSGVARPARSAGRGRRPAASRRPRRARSPRSRSSPGPSRARAPRRPARAPRGSGPRRGRRSRRRRGPRR